MKHISFVATAILILTIPCIAQKPPKIVGLLAVRNEQNYIAQCLRTLCLYTDAIVILDDASDDNTVAIIKSLAKQCNVAKIITKKTWLRDEPGDAKALLAAGRALGGTHFIHLDADEMFTANCLEGNFLRSRILELKPGDRLRMNWIQLWRSVDYYRFDSSIWTWNYKDFIFCDDGICGYLSGFIHTPRTPNTLQGTTYTMEGYTYGVLHFQFVNWRNLLIKQAWYRCLELIHKPTKSTVSINKSYAASKDETDLAVNPCPAAWFAGYTFFDPLIYQKSEQWREKQVLYWFAKYGKNYFEKLDIWDIDWGR
ncbi:MAG TPA: glycosyltransferase family A protein [Candidatus Limnocylindria bacterium]|nr:glycosyltransferase family A protein [Candidatus Limnocylindria bacterium]